MKKLFVIGILVISVCGASAVRAEGDIMDSARRMASDAAKATKSAAADAADYAGDAAVSAAVRAKLIKQDGLDSLDISIHTKDGMVVLSGVVDHAAQVSLAGRVARDAKGVKDVDNRLTSKDSKDIKDSKTTKESVNEYVDDAVITAEVKAKLLTQEGLGMIDIKVTTTEGVVRLEGTVGHQSQAALAELVAKDVKGVRKVDNQLKV